MPHSALQLLPRTAARHYEVMRVPLPDGFATTLHVARFDRTAFRARLHAVRGRTLIGWCAENHVRDAIVGGFFVRAGGAPLGIARVDGADLAGTVPFDAPWNRLRSCIHMDGDGIDIASPLALGSEPSGDVLQAGPLLVTGGVSVVRPGCDPEGFSAGARQFDSDITVGRYPRAALGLTSDRLIAAVCEGRADGEAGLTLAELAGTMVDLGAERAINLDGGGSASLVFGRRLRNRPREEHGIILAAGRPIATALAFEAV